MNFKYIISCVFTLLLVSSTVFAAPSKQVTSFDRNVSMINNCLENGDFRNADRLIFETIRNNPSDIQLKILSSLSLILQDKLDSAQDQLDIIKKSALKYADFYYAQGVIYLKRIDTSDMRFRAKNDILIQLAVNQLNYSLKINPKNSKVYNALGVAELKRGDLFRAEGYFEKAINYNSEYATAYDNLGTVYYITNELDKADYYFKKALSLNSTSATVYYHLAQVQFKNNNTQKALYYANKSLLWNKRSTYVYNLLGEIYKKQGNEAAAIVAFKKSIFLMPENSEPYINLANVYESRGDIDAAIEELKTSMNLVSNNDSIVLNLADLVLSAGRYDDAIKFYSMLSPKYKTEAVEGITSAYYSLATESVNKAMFRSNRRLADAMVYINQAIKENPDNLELYLTKSKLTKLINNPVDSKDVLLKIVSAPNSNLADMLMKGDAYISLQQYRDARNIYTLAVKTQKTLDSDLYLAEFFTYNKQYSMAKDVLNNILSQDSDNMDALNNLAYINKMEERSNLYYTNSKYLKKHHNKFFQKVYLKKSIKFNPNNIDANIDLGKILKKEKDYSSANNCFKVVLGASDNEKQIKKIAKISKRLDAKITRIEQKKLLNEQKIENNKLKKYEKVIPVKNKVEGVGVPALKESVNESVKTKNNNIKPVKNKTKKIKDKEKQIETFDSDKKPLKEEIQLEAPLNNSTVEEEVKRETPETDIKQKHIKTNKKNSN